MVSEVGQLTPREIAQSRGCVLLYNWQRMAA